MSAYREIGLSAVTALAPRRSRIFAAPAAAWSMGILNVTPDSFSDGGLYLAADRAIARGLALAAERALMVGACGPPWPAGVTSNALDACRA